MRRAATGTWRSFLAALNQYSGQDFAAGNWIFATRRRLRDRFAAVMPDAVIHAAAVADIDYCQSHQDLAEAVNVGVTQELARLCRDSGAKLIFCSTDSVFDGRRGMYVEQDEPRAVNYYADTKIRGEQAVRETWERSVVARLALVVGWPESGVGNSFLAKMISTLQAGDEFRVPDNEFRTPIDVVTLGRALLELAANEFTGTLHLAGNTRLTRFEMACRIADRLKLAESAIVATDSNAMPGRAPRPNDASLDNSRAADILTTPMQSVGEGLETILASTKDRP